LISIKEESDFYRQYKDKVKKIGVARFKWKEYKPMVSIKMGNTELLGYRNGNIPGFSAVDTFQLAFDNISTGKERIDFQKGLTGYSTCDSSGILKQFDIVKISEELTETTSDAELNELCDKYQVDAIVCGTFTYVIKEEVARVGQYSIWGQPDYDPGQFEEQPVLETDLDIDMAVYLKHENKKVLSYTTKGLQSLNRLSSVRPGGVAKREKKNDDIAWITLSRTIRQKADDLIMRMGQYYRFERAK
jgi:hypothetical protein